MKRGEARSYRLGRKQTFPWTHSGRGCPSRDGQRTSLADTVTQMGRWFGHKNVPGQSYLHLLRVYMHRDSLRLFRDIAAEELRFRAMLKESINNGESPSETLYVMEQSPLFKLTNPQKGRQLSNYTLNDYRRNRATYKRFSPHLKDLVHNANARQALFKDLEASYGSQNPLGNGDGCGRMLNCHTFSRFLLNSSTSKPEHPQMPCSNTCSCG